MPRPTRRPAGVRRLAGVVPAVLLAAAGLTACAPTVAAAPPEPAAPDTTALQELVVSGRPLVRPTHQPRETVATGSAITRTGLDALGARATASLYEAIDLLPGVTVTGADPYGLAAEQRTLRLRGVRGILGAVTVAGVPNYGGNPMGPRDYLYDTENLAAVAVYRGAVPADLGTGVGARGGAVALRPRWPGAEPAVQFGQSLGLDRYRRTFVRLDTGRLGGAGTRVALSGSLTDAGKWKGPGELGPRENASVMLTQPIGARDTVAVWLNLSELDQHLYRPLSYAQVQDLDANRDLDYNGRLTGDRAADILHYDHNRGRYRNRDLLARVPVTLGDRWRLTVTPYWSREDTGIRGGAPRGGGVIRVRSRDITRQGVTARLDTDLGWARATLGTWHEALDMDIGIASVHPVTGALLGRSVGVESDDDATSAAPYLRLAGEYGGLSWQAGLKYFAFREPRSEGTVFPPPDFQPEPAADLVRSARTYDAWLPTVGLSRRLGPGATLVASYGRGQIRPYAYLPLINLYNGNRAAFQAAGVTLDDLFAGYAMETSDTVELGARLRLGRLTARPTVYRATHDNLLTTVSDPRVDLSYFQNVGQATGTGVELEATYDLADAVTLFCNPAWVRLTYDQDLTFQGNTLVAEGNQVVATPEWTVQAGALMRWGALELTPRLRYLGERFGDVEHRERIDAALVADLRAAYTLRDVAGGHRLRVTLEVINLLDTGYVAVIDASDDDRAGEASYHVGAPATALVSLALGF